MRHVSKLSLVFVALWSVLALWTVGARLSSGGDLSPSYSVVGGTADYEIRAYDGYLEARVSMTGSRSFAIDEGTRVLFAYIKGDNVLQEAVAPARPEGVEPGPAQSHIASWAPIAVYVRGDSYDISVMLPSRYTNVTLPRPNNSAIRIVQVAPATYAVTRWRGLSDAERVSAEEARLRGLLGGQKRAILSTARTVRYGRPWIPSPFELNEMQIPVGPERE